MSGVMVANGESTSTPVELDQGRHLPASGEGEERRQSVVVEDLGDQEDGIGAGHPGLDDLIFIDQEVFAEQGDGDRRPDSGEVGQVPLEIRSVGQDAQAGGAVGLIRPGDGDRVEVGPDDLGRGAGLLDLGQEPDRAWSGEGGPEVADRWRLGRLGLQLLKGESDPGRGDLATLGRDDLVEDGRRRHGRLPPLRWIFRSPGPSGSDPTPKLTRPGSGGTGPGWLGLPGTL